MYKTRLYICTTNIPVEYVIPLVQYVPDIRDRADKYSYPTFVTGVIRKARN